MFRIISIAGFAVTFAVIIFHCIICRPKPANIFDRKSKSKFINIITLLVFVVTLLCFINLVITGFYMPLVLQTQISGYLLMLHATCAPVFAGCIAVLAVLWSHNCCLNKRYLPWLQKLLGRTPVSEDPPQKNELTIKLSFWLILILSLLVILSILLSMLPFCSIHIQEMLLDCHRYTALALSLIALIYLYLLIATRTRKAKAVK